MMLQSLPQEFPLGYAFHLKVLACEQSDIEPMASLGFSSLHVSSSVQKKQKIPPQLGFLDTNLSGMFPVNKKHLSYLNSALR